MKIRKLVVGLIVSSLVFAIIPTVSFAAPLDEIKSQQQATQEEMAQLDSEISQALVKVNEANSGLEKLRIEIEDKEASIADTTEHIEEQALIVDARMEQAKERLLNIQTSEVNQNVVLSLLESENISDLLNRAYILATLQSAGNDQLELAEQEKNELEQLEAKLAEDMLALEAQSAEAEKQKADLDNQINDLQLAMDENQEILDQLDEQQRAEETRIAEAEAAEQKRIEEAAARAKAEQEQADAEQEQAELAAAQREEEQSQTLTVAASEKTASTVSYSSGTSAIASPAVNQPAEKKESSSTSSSTAAKTLVVSATGYSTQQAGLSTHTSSGIDLRKNPNVIAVDPSVIPIGTRVEIPGQGVFVAGDTGGAIKGNKIDIHFSSVSQALSWGRRTVTITILN